MSPTTVHLAYYLLDIVMNKDITLAKDIKLYTPVALLLAAKTIELDEKIPYITRLRKNSCMDYTIQEYKQAELKMLELVGWNTQFTSALEFMEFFLSQGVLFSSDNILGPTQADQTNFEAKSPRMFVEKKSIKALNKGVLQKSDSSRSPQSTEGSTKENSFVDNNNTTPDSTPTGKESQTTSDSTLGQILGNLRIGSNTTETREPKRGY
mmetsp:Transcript_16270/g.13913  ORF Transcript_16270/g.13913 Transcript_16270/m.13913 type:complete len:209 (+) Transcript_16270:456-1082(+)